MLSELALDGTTKYDLSGLTLDRPRAHRPQFRQPHPQPPVRQKTRLIMERKGMKARQFKIEHKHRRDVGFVASVDDFTLSGSVETAVSTIIDNPAVSLYCFDAQRRQAVFVELPQHIDLATEPFVYLSQFEYAQQIFTLPFPLFNELAKELPAIPRPIFIHITARSGSTLLSHVLNASGLVKSLAEPDVVSQFASLRYQSETVEEAELRELADSTMRFLFKGYHQPGILSHAVKFRNQGTLVMDVFQSAFPQGKNIFLYRNVVDFVSSFQRILRMAGLPESKRPYGVARRVSILFSW